MLIGDQQMIAVELKHIPSGRPIFDSIHEVAGVSQIFTVKATRIRIVRIPTLSDTCSNSCRTAFQSCRTGIGAKRRAG